MSDLRVEFIGWHKSALELVGEKLLAMEKTAPDAFRRATVVTPTAESGRRLKEWMAEQAGRPLLMPRMVLIGQLIRAQGENVAGEIETLAAWVEALTERAPHEAWPALFPRAALERHLQAWALGTADRLMQLQLQMEQYEVGIDALLGMLHSGASGAGDFAERWLAVHGDEEARWHELQALFDTVDAKLEAWGRVPSRKARAAALEAAHQQRGLLIIACLPELSPQVQRYLRARSGETLIWVNAPEELREGFDEVGGVNENYWVERPLPAEFTDASIIVAPTAQSLAREAVAAVGDASQDEVALGACDASFTPALASEFAKYGWQVHVPEGRSVQTTDLYALPGLLAEACMASYPSMASMAPLLRNVAAQRLVGVSPAEAYRFGLLIDKLEQRYLPDSASELLRLLNPESRLPGQSRDVEQIEEWRVKSFFDAVRELVGLIELCRHDLPRGLSTLEQRMLSICPTPPLDSVAQHMAAKVRQVAGFVRTRSLPAAQAWAILRHVLRECEEPLQETAREDTHVDALGWRELAYATGSKLILTGMHERCVPELPTGEDPFLPDTLRQLLGMPCVRSREARDTFLLTALLQRQGVEKRVIISRSAADGSGSPVEPSSLLYHCAPDQLAMRVQHLFRELPVESRDDKYEEWSLAPADAVPASGRGMESVSEQLAPHWVNVFSLPDHRFSPSEINAFLACPLRFWMKYALGISPWDAYKADKVEMEAAEYGTLLHAVLEKIASRYPKKETLLPPADMLSFALEELDRQCVKHYGARTLPSMVRRQKLRLERSLSRFLEWHCEQLRLGWECYACEHRVKDWPLHLPDGSTALVSMRADRIDCHPEKGWRIIDYKTHARTPKEDHLERVPEKKRELFEELMGKAGFPLLWLPSERKGAEPLPYRWKDVQLPMYAAWLAQEMQAPLPSVAYYNLPRSGKSDMRCNECQEMTLVNEETLENALTWAKSAVMHMRAGTCLYSAESFGCSAFGSYSEDEDLSDPRSLFHTLPPLESP